MVSEFGLGIKDPKLPPHLPTGSGKQVVIFAISLLIQSRLHRLASLLLQNYLPTNTKITHSHRTEWQQSAVSDALTDLNVLSLSGRTALDYLFYSDKLPRRNDGRVAESIYKRYRILENYGGWWVSGVDVLTGEDSEWGQYKSDKPRVDRDRGKPIKYEAPPKIATEILALKVPKALWKQISGRFDVPISGRGAFDDAVRGELHDRNLPVSPCPPQTHFRSAEFWTWVHNHPELPLTITEGAKKAACLLSAGYIAIALPGIFSGYRQPKDQNNKPLGKPKLIPQLAHFAQNGRKIYFAYDKDKKFKTRQAVQTAIDKTAQLLAQEGCQTYVIEWSESSKGVDDLIVEHGQEAFDRTYENAQSLKVWRARNLISLTYTPDSLIKQRYLEDTIAPSCARLICVKSPKNTGKTSWLEKQIEELISSGERKILLLTHRIQLGEELCRRLGIDYVTELRTSDTGGVFGYGLCVDSLHGKSQARFNPADWEGAVVIIDECEQVLWHMLNSSTCRKNRVAILRTFKQVIRNSLAYGGKVYLSDADLSNISINYIKNIARMEGLEPWVLVNEYQPESPWDVYHFGDKTPARMIRQLIKHIRKGGKPFICLSGQKEKSQYGTTVFEAFLQRHFPHLRILRIDSASISDPNNPAFGCMTALNRLLADYDIVICSPAIETGVSIEFLSKVKQSSKVPIAFELLKLGIVDIPAMEIEQPHFDSVWSINQGVQSTNSARQSLARWRFPVPRYVWIAKMGLEKIGNGGLSAGQILASQNRQLKTQIQMLTQADWEDGDFDFQFQGESLEAWAKYAAAINVARLNYRETILGELRSEGHNIIEFEQEGSEDGVAEIKAQVKECKEEVYDAYCLKVEQAENPSDLEYEKLKEKRGKCQEEHIRFRHGFLARRYGVLVTAALVRKDEKNWHSKLWLHYLLTKGRDFVPKHDAHNARIQIERGDGAVFAPDFVRSQVGLKIWVLEQMGIHNLLVDRERRADDEAVVATADFCIKYHREVYDCLGIKALNRDGTPKTPMQIVSKILELLGLRSVQVRREGKRGQQVRVYSAPMADCGKDEHGKVVSSDGRSQVFEFWHARDLERFGGESAPVVTTGNNKISSSCVVTTNPVTTTENLGEDGDKNLVTTPENQNQAPATANPVVATEKPKLDPVAELRKALAKGKEAVESTLEKLGAMGRLLSYRGLSPAEREKYSEFVSPPPF